MIRIGLIDLDYLGAPLATLILPGRRLCWPVQHIGRALGYGPKGHGLLPRMRHDWSDLFGHGSDYLVLRGAELAAVKAAQDPERPVVPDSASRITVLLRQGLEQVLDRSQSSRALTLRSFLDTHLPEHLSTRLNSSEKTKSALSQAIERIQRLTVQRTTLTASREGRLGQLAETRDAQQRLEERRFQVHAIHRVIDTLEAQGVLDPEVRLALEIEACAVATDDRVVMLGARDVRPLVEDEDDEPQAAGQDREKLQLDAMLREGGCPLVLAWETDGRLGAFRYFPGLLDLASPPASEQPDAA